MDLEHAAGIPEIYASRTVYPSSSFNFALMCPTVLVTKYFKYSIKSL